MRLIARRAAGLAALGTLLLQAAPVVQAEEQRRQIEEVLVTAERRESSVQDTAISITAFTGEFIEDFGLRNQEDLQAYLPATTVQPYDVAIRGVGRLFRALGGDPGVATYFDGAYSEDFGIASTEGGLYDLARIEVLRGPQGTLYGRNGVGGAINFINNKPTDEFEGEVRTVLGTDDTFELYGLLSGPITDKLLARFTGVKRTRDGLVKERGDGPDQENYGDENYALALQWNPSDTVTIDLRGNERSYRRVMASAQGAGAIVTSENGGLGDPVTGALRDTSSLVWGYRAVDPNTACLSAVDRSVVSGLENPALPGSGTMLGCTVGGQQLFQFNHNGLTRFAQRVTPGVDAVNSEFARPNFQRGADQALIDSLLVDGGGVDSDGNRGNSVGSLDGDDLQVWTNGLNDEYFDHQSAILNAAWDVSDSVTIKYIGGYTDYLYQRTTDDDRTGQAILDEQFYAAQENENFQHELQFFIDFSADFTLTSGLFYYENQIDQRLDFYSSNLPRLTQAADLGNQALPFLATLNPGGVTHNTARDICGIDLLGGGSADRSARVDGPAGSVISASCLSDGPWIGETLGDGNRTQSGPDTAGTSFIWDTENRTTAYAVYSQAEWQINETWALTFGGRYARDEKEGEESLFLYRETALAPADLLSFNQSTGALDANGNPTACALAEECPIRFRGVPFARSLYRAIENDYDAVTYRVNIDYTPSDAHLIYLSGTSGYRAGGFNLGFFSAVPSYDSEEVFSVELGYKGQLLDNRLQINASVYNYTYDDVHLQFAVSTALAGTSTSVTNAPEARNSGFEADFLWLATDRLTLGGSFSWTDTEYTKELPAGGIIDTQDPFAPIGSAVDTVYNTTELTRPIKGTQLLRIPEFKFSAWAMYMIPMGENGNIEFITSYSWQDDVVWNVSNSDRDTAPDFARWDARANWTSADERWVVGAYVNNILDEIGVRSMNAEDQSQGYLRTATPTLPRQAGVELRYRFGAFR
ncbi:MAG: TonB-dependent receptor [Pseudomonadota bacterium]